MSNSKDQIYRNNRRSGKKFTFDDDVADVFSDMISRSVPGYRQILELLPTLVRHFQAVGGDYYDLGCSLGASMQAMAEGLEPTTPNQAPASLATRTIIGVDNSAAMIARARRALAQLPHPANVQLELHCADIVDFKLLNAALVCMNFTLQFIPAADRDRLVKRIYSALNSGGALILSEKIVFEDAATDQALTDIHHQYKADQGYSAMEIARKRDAIENVLIPETLQAHHERLSRAGFSIVTPWIQNLQFISILAIK